MSSRTPQAEPASRVAVPVPWRSATKAARMPRCRGQASDNSAEAAARADHLKTTIFGVVAEPDRRPPGWRCSTGPGVVGRRGIGDDAGAEVPGGAGGHRIRRHHGDRSDRGTIPRRGDGVDQRWPAPPPLPLLGLERTASRLLATLRCLTAMIRPTPVAPLMADILPAPRD